MTVKNSPFFPNFEPKRDAYGFTVRPQHLQRYREYATIYREEEEERSEKWKGFLDNQEESSQPHASEQLDVWTVDLEVINQQQTVPAQASQEEGNDPVGENPVSDIKRESDLKRELPAYLPEKSCHAYTWSEIRASLSLIDHLMSFRVKKTPQTKVKLSTDVHNHLATIKEPEESEEENGEERSVNEELGDGSADSGVSPELSFPWKELEFLVRGGVPRDLRGEVWQAFVGVRARRLKRYYLVLLDPESDTGDGQEHDGSSLAEENKRPSKESIHVPEKLRKQIEKDLPRTFPGHPALDERGRNSLRRLLIAYARHNPDVGYCQAMNFFAGILLLMMPEENAFCEMHNLRTENLRQQYHLVKKRTANGNTAYGSHVMQFGDLQLSMESLFRFMGTNPANDNYTYVDDNSLWASSKAVNQRDADLLHFWDKFRKAPEGSARKVEAQKQFTEAMSHRMHLDERIALVGKLLFGIQKGPEVLKHVRSAGQPLVDDWACLKSFVRTFESHCGSLSQYGMKHMRSIANICNAGIQMEQMVEASVQTCPSIPPNTWSSLHRGFSAALVGLIDEYFDGCYSQEMIESQVDQLVFEELVRERFPKLVNHLDYLGMQVAWISGPWFLSIFVNVLPWESVLRVWDVLLFEGNRVMLFRTALALMELYGPAVVTTKDAGDAITLFQSLTGSTFDSSQLVLTACMGFLNVTEDRLLALREKHRPAVLAVTQERSKGGPVKKDPKGLASKLYSFKHDPDSFMKETKPEECSGDKKTDNKISDSNSNSASMDEFLNSLNIDSHMDSLPGLQEQVVWLKVELCRTLEDKRAATLRAEELETALMEMVKEDNRQQLSARVEQLEQEVADLRHTLNDKKEQEKAMLEVLMRVEQEQKVTEDARIAAEQDVAAQKYAVHVLQEKYEKAMASVAQMEKRVVMAESMLEATLQYESGQVKALSSPRSTRPDSPQGAPAKRTGLLSFGLGWRDRNKAKPSNLNEMKSADEGPEMSSTATEANGQQE